MRVRLRYAVVAALALLLLVAGAAALQARDGADDPAAPEAGEPTTGRTAAPAAPTPSGPEPTAPGTAAPTAGHAHRAFRVASFNVLGASHTRPGGDRPGWAPAVPRMRLAVRALAGHRVDVVGFQEFEPVQARAFDRMAGRAWGLFPGDGAARGDVRQSIAWRRDTWALVRTDTFASPYFNGNLVDHPVVLLRHRGTGREVYFVNVHNPADTRRFSDQQQWRDEATRRQVALVQRLRDRGRPVVLTGDMNERTDYFCAVSGAVRVVSANGGATVTRSGSRPGYCRAPRVPRIDWIIGTHGLRFDDYVRDQGGVVRRASDHALVAATGHLPPGGRPDGGR